MRLAIPIRNIATATLLAALFAPAGANAQDWKLDNAHSRAGFAIRHMMVSNVRGKFDDVSGSAEYDGKSIGSIKVTAKIKTASVDTGDSKRDEHLRGAEFFDVKKYPDMTFKSKKVVKGSGGQFKLIGDLTLHGVTKTVTLNVDGPTKEVKDPWGKIRIGASASTKINRKDFGITYGGNLDNGGAIIGDDVKITLDIEMVKKTDDSSKKKPKKG